MGLQSLMHYTALVAYNMTYSMTLLQDLALECSQHYIHLTQLNRRWLLIVGLISCPTTGCAINAS